MIEQISCGYGKGSIRIRNGNYYFRQTIKGKDIESHMPNVTSREEALQEAARLRTVSSAETIEEVALITARAKGIIKQNNSLPLIKIFEEFEKSPNRPQCGKTSLARNKRNIEHFVSFMNMHNSKCQRMSDITSTDADSWAASIYNMSSANYNAYTGSLKLAFRVLFKQSGLNINPFIHLPRKDKSDVKNKKEFNSKQLKKILNAVDGEYPLDVLHRDEMKILFRLGAYTGMRLKDCCLIKWGDFKKNLSIMKIKPCKTVKSNKRVEIPVHPELRHMLNYQHQDNDAYVLPAVAERYQRNLFGVDLTACNIIWWALTSPEKHAQKLENRSKYASNRHYRPEPIPGYGFHSFRHSFVSFCANAGVPMAAVQQVIGDTSEMVTRVYTHITQETMQQVMAALPVGDNTPATQLTPEAAKLAKIAAIVDNAPKGSRWAANIRGILEG